VHLVRISLLLCEIEEIGDTEKENGYYKAMNIIGRLGRRLSFTGGGGTMHCSVISKGGQESVTSSSYTHSPHLNFTDSKN